MVCGAIRQRREALFRRGQLPRQILAFGPVELEIEGEPVAPLPSVLRQQDAAAGEILQGRGIGGRRLGALARHQVEPGDLLALRRGGDQRRAAVELVHDVEYLLFQLLGGGSRREQPADPQMRHDALALGNERVGRLLDAVVEEGVGGIGAADEPGADGFPEGSVDRRLASAMDQRQRRRLGQISQAGELAQRFLGRERQAAQLRCHEIHDIVGEALGADARQVPAPTGRTGFEDQQRLFGQRAEELDREEGIAGRLFEHQLGQGRRAPRLRMQRIRQQPRHIRGQKRRQQDLLQSRPGVAAPSLTNRPQHSRQRMRGRRPRCRGRRRSAADGAPRDG